MFLKKYITAMLLHVCRLSWLTNSALIYKPKYGGKEGVSANEYSCAQCDMEPK